MSNQTYAKPNGLSLAALIFGILAFLGSFCVLTTPFLASMAVMFSWLSRGDRKMNGQAIAGNILALAAAVISLVILVLALTVMRTTLDGLLSMGADYFTGMIGNLPGGM